MSILRWAIAAFFASELLLVLLRNTRRTAGATPADRGTRLTLVVVITAGLALAVIVSQIPAATLPWSVGTIRAVSLALLATGVAIRWWAVITLGKYFTVDVAIHERHALVMRGPYRFVRHPSYTGLIFAFAGIGFALGNAASVLCLTVLVIAPLVVRMRVEEAALLRAIGPAYTSYCASTKRLIPGVY